MAEQQITRRLAAILAADVAGYSRMMEVDEAGTLERVTNVRREIFEPHVARHHGRIFKAMGDGFLAEFASVIDAVHCALKIQSELARQNGINSDAEPIEFRVGINVGDVVDQKGDLFGDGVNIAARLESLAEPGSIYVTHRVQEDAVRKIGATFEDLGEHTLRNISRPIRVYRLGWLGSTITATGPGPTLRLPDKPSIAVLPFQSMSVDVEQDYFCDGVVEDIITALSRIRSLFVIARNSSFTYKAKRFI